jgi:hypothetical protein
MSTTLTVFFGDKERDFRLTPRLILELERVTSVGIGGLCRRLFAGDFKFHDVAETIRGALIGGGETPERANELVETYVAGQPLAPSYALAVSILEVTWNGTPGAADADGATVAKSEAAE